jgi:hypothetical protein
MFRMNLGDGGRLIGFLAAWLLVAITAQAKIAIFEMMAEKAMTRAGRPLPVRVTVANDGPASSVNIRLEAPAPLVVTDDRLKSIKIPAGGVTDVIWEVSASEACRNQLRVVVEVDGQTIAQRELPVRFLPALPGQQLDYIPPPRPADSQLLIGAHHCPLWEESRPQMWDQILKYPERTPALGFYDQDNPEISDWETVWALEHGIDFFIYCWYRTSQGGPVETMFENAITKAFFESRYRKQMQFTIMWENQRRGVSGIADLKDLQDNLFPYWMDTFFQHPSYLKVDNKPVLFIYRPEFLVQDLGGEAEVAAALDWMRKACQSAGFDGLTILGEYRGLDANHLQLMKRLGLDYTFAYCWHVQGNPDPDRAIATQMSYIRQTQQLNILPQVVTVSQGWTGWRNEGSIWKIPPADYESLLRQANEFVQTIPPSQLGRKMLILDNWNEWGEGHYIAPYTDEGFGYLDAIRNVLTTAPSEHQDLIPEDLGMGPYDRAFRAHLEAERTRPQATKP